MKQEFVTLPREAVERAIEALKSDRGMAIAFYLEISALRAALEQPQNHVPDAGNMVPAGWRLVPIEPTDDMLYDIQEFSCILPPRGKRIWAHMLAAAPQPPTVKECLTVEQPQSDQPAMTPIAQRKLDSLLTDGYTISGYSVYHEQKHQHGFVTGAGLVGWWKPEGMEYPQPQGEQEPVAEGDMVDPVSVPRGLLGAACFAIDHKRDAPKLLEKLRRYTVGDLSGNAAPQPPATPGEPSVAKVIGTDERGPMLLWHRAWTDFPNGTQLYTSPQPKREPLTDEEAIAFIKWFWGEMKGTPLDVHMSYLRYFEESHNIK